MAGLLPRILPEPEKFRRLSKSKRRTCLQEALGTFLDTLQVDGRDPRAFESLKFQSAMEALGEDNLDQAYEDAMALQRHAPVQVDDIAVSGQPLSRDEMATGLRSLLDHLQTHAPKRRAQAR